MGVQSPRPPLPPGWFRGVGGFGKATLCLSPVVCVLYVNVGHLPPSVQFPASPDTPGPESPGRPLVAKIPASQPPPGSSAALETIAQSLFGHSPPPSLTYAAPCGPSSSGTQTLQSRSLVLVPSPEEANLSPSKVGQLRVNTYATSHPIRK